MKTRRVKQAADDRLTLNDAARLIAEHDTRPNDTERAAVDRARNRIVNNYRLGKLARNPDGTYSLGELVQWARSKKKWLWADQLPANAVAEIRGGSGRCTAGVHKLRPVVLPSTIEECHALILEQHALILKQDEKLNMLEADRL